MQKKLRTINIDGHKYLWRTGTGDPFHHGTERWDEEFVAYMEGYKKSPLRILFSMGIVAQDGQLECEGNNKLLFDLNTVAYTPKGAEHFIKYGIRSGWDPVTMNTPYLIENSSDVVKSLPR